MEQQFSINEMSMTCNQLRSKFNAVLSVKASVQQQAECSIICGKEGLAQSDLESACLYWSCLPASATNNSADRFLSTRRPCQLHNYLHGLRARRHGITTVSAALSMHRAALPRAICVAKYLAPHTVLSEELLHPL